MPYGSGYSGGSVGGAVAQGLQSGFELGRRMDADREAVKQREFENARQTAQDERAQHAAELADTHNALAASRERLGMLATEGAGLAQQYGGDTTKIPVDIANDYAGRAQAGRRAHEALINKLAPVAQDWKQSAEDDASKMATGQLNPLDPKYPPAQLVHTLTATSRRPIQDFLPQGDQPAPVKQLVNDFQTGLQTNNEGLTLKALNGLFAPELKTGVGQPSPHGGVIVGKQIVKLLPAPPEGSPQQDPNAPPQESPNSGKVTPVLRVFVREGPDSQAGVGETKRMASVEQQQYGAPPGATGHYDAPVTQNRSTDPNDPIAHISMEDAMNRIGQMQTLATAMDNPDFRAKVEQGIKAAGNAPDAFLQSLYAVGGKMPAKVQTTEHIPIGPRGTLLRTTNPQGVETSREMIAPPEGTATGVLAKKLADIEASGVTDTEKAKAKRIAMGLEKVKAAGGTATGMPAPSLDPKTVDFYATQSIAGNNDWQVGLARGKVGQQLISAVKDRIPKMAEELGLSPQDVGTNKATSVALSTTLKDLTKRSAAVDMFASKVEKDMKTFDSLLDSAASDSPLLINKPLNVLRRQFSDPKLAQLDLAAKQVGAEYERLITGGTLSVAQLHAGASEDAKKLLNGDMPPKQARAVLETMRAEMKNAKDSAHESQGRVQDQLRGLGKSGAKENKPAISADDDALINKYLKK